VETGPITPAQALKRYSEYLTPFEQSEVLQYQQVGARRWHGHGHGMGMGMNEFTCGDGPLMLASSTACWCQASCECFAVTCACIGT
jgi:hypothetical protein